MTRTAIPVAATPPAGLGWVDRAVVRGVQVPAWVAVLTLGVMLVAAWVAVYTSGGTQRALPHLFYIPIILATLPFGLRGSIGTSAVAAVICGPLMPLSTVTGEPQQVGSWLFRAAMFMIVGSIASLALTMRDRVYQQQLASEVRNAITRSESGGPDVDESLLPLIDEVIDTQAFHSVYQPIYSLADGMLIGVEALTRFDVEPYRTPDLWFAAAHQVGRGTELELAAIQLALTTAHELPPTVELSVNASPATLGEAGMLDLVRSAHGRQLTVEITEHAVVEDYHLLQGTVDALRFMGVKIAVDDAGAGFASLRHIVQLAPDTIKLDMSLTQNLAGSPLRRALAGSLIEFAHRTGAQLVVEGIEEVGDLTTWASLGAHAVQGFLVGLPQSLPVPGVSPVITNQRARITAGNPSPPG
ncbi:EAL domain-containing protein [Cellulomonas sp. KRMCY2]|uniref:EAL domain-containing protein n=1 Tax=Cellulomonas sp. KRMCY2 TaxID=1304865 RepID=UPI0004B2CA79|nr:EAL domain-containing protein [Cellulomonas sp. KRMCY2]